LDHGEIAYEVSEGHNGLHVAFYESNCLDLGINAKTQAELYASARTHLPAALRALIQSIETFEKIETGYPERLDGKFGYAAQDDAKRVLAEIEKEFE
jgi:hypothetical protein